jgi:hypothetical protein
MPELVDCEPDLFLRFAITALDEGMSREQHWFTANLTRLTDKAIREYEAARNCLGSFISGRAEAEARPGWESATVPIEVLSQLLMAADHLENCVDALRRAESFLKTTFFVDVVRATGHDYPEFLTELHDGIRNLRNAIQHADEHLAKGRVGEGSPVFISVGSDAIRFAGETVLHSELAAVIVTLRQMALAAIDAAA